MQKTILPLLLVALAGCQSTVKPFERQGQRADDPLLSASEQQRKARYLHPFPDQELGPKSGLGERDLIGPHHQ